MQATLSFSKNWFTFLYKSVSVSSTDIGLDKLITSSLLNTRLIPSLALLLFCSDAFNFFFEVGVMCSHIILGSEGEDEEKDGGGVANGVANGVASSGVANGVANGVADGVANDFALTSLLL